MTRPLVPLSLAAARRLNGRLIAATARHGLYCNLSMHTHVLESAKCTCVRTVRGQCTMYRETWRLVQRGGEERRAGQSRVFFFGKAHEKINKIEGGGFAMSGFYEKFNEHAAFPTQLKRKKGVQACSQPSPSFSATRKKRGGESNLLSSPNSTNEISRIPPPPVLHHPLFWPHVPVPSVRTAPLSPFT